jgi:hypothetical protein
LEPGILRREQQPMVLMSSTVWLRCRWCGLSFLVEEEFSIVQLGITQVFLKKNLYILLCSVVLNGHLMGNIIKNETIK